MPYTMVRILKGKGTNIMGMAASQARLLSITSRMADNELRAQIANNAKMRLAADSSRISADYVNALNNATMMITNYNEAGDSQFSKLTFNRLTQYSPFNTQYGLANTYGQLLVNENEAKIFEAAGGELTEYLKAHGLKFDTTYFTPQSFDGKTNIEFNDEFGNVIGNFELEELKTMYFGGKIDNVDHKGFADNEDVYDSFLKSVSNFSVAYNRCQNDSDIIEHYVTPAIKEEVNKFSSIGNESRYEFYRNVASGVNDLSGISATQLREYLLDAIRLVEDISINGDPNDPKAYVTGATDAYYKTSAVQYLNNAGNGIKDLTEFGYKIESINNKSYYIFDKESIYGEKVQTVKNYVDKESKTWMKISGTSGDLSQEDKDFRVWTGGVWHDHVDYYNGVPVIADGNGTINKNNTYLIQVQDWGNYDSVNKHNLYAWDSENVGSRNAYGALPQGYIGLSKNSAGQIIFLYGQNNSDDKVITYADLGTNYGSFVDKYAGDDIVDGHSGIYEIDLFGQGNACTYEHDDTLAYLLYDPQDNGSHRQACRTADNHLFTNITTAQLSKAMDIPDNKLEAFTKKYEAFLTAQQDYKTKVEAYNKASDSDKEDAKKAMDTAYEVMVNKAGDVQNFAQNDCGINYNPLAEYQADHEGAFSNVLTNAFLFYSDNRMGGNPEVKTYHNFAWDGKYFVIDPDGYYITTDQNGKNESKSNYSTKIYTFDNNNVLKTVEAYTEEQLCLSLLKTFCEDAFGHEYYYVSPKGDVVSRSEAEDANGKLKKGYENYSKELGSSGNYHYTVNILEYIERAAKQGNENAIAAVDIKKNVLEKFGVDLSRVSTNDFTYIGGFVDDLLSDKIIDYDTNGEPKRDASGAIIYRNKTAEEKETCQSIYDNYVLNCLFDIYGDPNVTWIDENNPTGDAEAKVKWYTNLFERMSKGYKVLEDGLAGSNEWMEYALESGLVAIEQVDKDNRWNGTPYSNVATITEVTDEVAVAKAEAEYKKAMNEVENKDKRLDIELKNIDTEHNALQTEYESVKSVISKNVERSFKMYNA